MISSKKLWRLRRQTMRATGKYDAELAALADRAAADGKPYYEMIQNPTTQDIYRYLCDFVAAVATENTGRKPSEIRVLDWGGGKGYAAHFLQQLGFDVTLFETSSFPHREFWKTSKLITATSDGPALPFEDKAFDIVVGFGVLEHVPYEYDALKEVNRVLRDDGLFMCFNLPSWSGYLHHVAAKRGVKYHDRLYGVREVRWLLKRTGFNAIGRPWYRQLFPKNAVRYKHWAAWEQLDLLLCRYTPLTHLATSLEFVARKQYTYTAPH